MLAWAVSALGTTLWMFAASGCACRDGGAVARLGTSCRADKDSGGMHCMTTRVMCALGLLETGESQFTWLDFWCQDCPGVSLPLAPLIFIFTVPDCGCR